LRGKITTQPWLQSNGQQLTMRKSEICRPVATRNENIY
jgi:hypothetical protein